MTLNLNDIKAIPIENFMSKLGYEIKSTTAANIFFNSPFREEKTASFAVWKNKNLWKDWGTHEGGDIIELAQRIWNTDFKKTIERLAKENYISIENKSLISEKKYKVEIKKTSDKVQNKALINYMIERNLQPEKIDGLVGEIYYYLLDENTGELKLHPKTGNTKEYFSLAFKSDLGGYELRNKYLKNCHGQKHFSTIKNGFDAISVFEGFIDFLSLASYKEIKSDILVLNSCAMAAKAIPVINEYKKAYLMLDNDKAGNQTTELIINEATSKCIDLREKLYKGFKDINNWIQSPDFQKI